MVFSARGVNMYYEISGDTGSPLLLLHGWGGSGQSFLPVIRDMSPSHVVYSVDFPGHGKSDAPDEPWSVTEYMEYIRAFLDELGLEKVDIVAHSFGGRVAILLAATYPDRVGKMTLTGAAGIPPKSTGKKTLKKRVYRLLRGIASSRAVERIVGGKTAAAWREALVQRFGSPDYRALTPQMRRTFNLVIAQDLTGYLNRIKAPTLLIWGEDDTETPIWMGQKMRDLIPDAGLVSWPGCGHFAYLDRYADFIAALKSFMG